MFIAKYCSVALLVMISGSGIAQQKQFDFKHARQEYSTTAALRSIRQGFNMRLWMNNDGRFGYGSPLQYPSPFLEYPIGSRVEHLFAAAPWVGAILIDSAGHSYRAVTTVYDQGLSESRGIDTTFWETSIDSANGHNSRFYDDDGDGKIDEDELDGIDNDGDGKVDEDYGAVSEHDIYFAYADTFPGPFNNYTNHRPLGIKVIQHSYAWDKTFRQPILPIEYTIVNIGKNTLVDPYVAFYCDFDVLLFDVTDQSGQNYSGYFPDIHTLFVQNPFIQDYTTRQPMTPIGLTLLSSSKPLQDLQYIYRWYIPGGGEGETNDTILYNSMVCANFPPPLSCINR